MIKYLYPCLAILLLIVHLGMGEDVGYVFGEKSNYVVNNAIISEAKDTDIVPFTTAGVKGSVSTPNMKWEVVKKIFKSKIEPGKVHHKAQEIIQAKGYTTIGQICDIYKYLTTNWNYQPGPKNETYDYLDNASTILSYPKKGDCNAFAILMASMVESISGTSRIVLATGPTSGHAYAEVYVGNLIKNNKNVMQIIDWLKKKYNKKEIDTHKEPSGDTWLNLDWGEDFSKPAMCPGGCPLFSEATTSTVVYTYQPPMTSLNTAPLSRFTIISSEKVNASEKIELSALNISNVDSITAYNWTFGDQSKPESSEIPKINHTYMQGGNYTVCLIVTDKDNLTDSWSTIICVRGSGNQSGPVIDSFSAYPENITSGGSSSLSWKTLGASNVTLSPDFGIVNSNETVQVSPEATTTYMLNASNSKGFNVRTITILVKQKPKPLAQPEGIFSYNPMKPKVGDLITFDSSKSIGVGGNINYSEWNFGDGNYNSSRICLHAYNRSSDYTVVLAVTDDNGQRNYTLKRISVLPRDLAVDSFNFTPNPVCSGLTTVMSWATTGATNVVVTPAVGNLPASGSQPIYSEQSMGYTIQAYNDTAQTKPKTVFLEVKQCGLQVPSGAATPNIGTTPGTRVIEGTVKYVGGNIVRIGVTVKLQEIFNGMTYDIDSTVSRRGDGTFKIVYSPESLKNPYNPTLNLQAFYGDKPLSDPVNIGNNRRVDLICSPH